MKEYLDPAELDAWNLVHAAARAVSTFDITQPRQFSLGTDGQLRPLSLDGLGAVLSWNPATGWESMLPSEAPHRDLLDLYLPISSATATRPMTIGHLGQSLDGFIATASGDSCSLTGPDNILHLHRLRALCDVIVVGASTVAADNPRLTTRLVSGRNPVRVILDPTCRLPATHTVFSDRDALTLRVCAAGIPAVTEARARGEQVLEVAAFGHQLDLKDLLHQLHARGYSRIFVEGGGITVSSFLEAGVLDRLHVAIAPLLIGDGRPAIRMASRVRLSDCLRFRHRVFRSGQDILYDCDLRATLGSSDDSPTAYATLRRVL